MSSKEELEQRVEQAELSLLRERLRMHEERQRAEQAERAAESAVAEIFKRTDQLKQAERERDERLTVESADAWLAHRFNEVWEQKQALEARLAKADKLAEVLRGISTYERLPEWMREKALEVLAEWKK